MLMDAFVAYFPLLGVRAGKAALQFVILFFFVLPGMLIYYFWIYCVSVYVCFVLLMLTWLTSSMSSSPSVLFFLCFVSKQAADFDVRVSLFFFCICTPPHITGLKMPFMFRVNPCNQSSVTAVSVNQAPPNSGWLACRGHVLCKSQNIFDNYWGLYCAE